MAASSAPEIGTLAREPYRGPANLKGKIAVVTGGTQGLGESIARLFAERGAAGIVICGRNSDNGARVAKEISATGCPAVFVKADLAKVADCRKVVAEADKRFGRVDILVNAAALTDRGDIFDIDWMLTIAPAIFSRRMIRTASWMRKKGARTLTSKISLYRSSVVSKMSPRSVSAAALTRM